MDTATTRIGMMATQAIDVLIEAVEQTPPEMWDRDLVGHATGSAAKIVALVEGGEMRGGPSRPADWVSDDPPARLMAYLGRSVD